MSVSVLESELRAALETGAGLDVLYQPVFSASDLTVSGVEALARWEHPTLGPIAPLTFIPLAEECGLIGALGDWVMRTACKAAGRVGCRNRRGQRIGDTIQAA